MSIIGSNLLPKNIYLMYICETMVTLREFYVKAIINKEKKVTEVADILHVTRKTVHKWVAKYKIHGRCWLQPKKSWPKSSIPWNKTEEEIEDKVIALAYLYPMDGPVTLSMYLEEKYDIKIDQTTVYRILKRRWIKYGATKREKRRKMKLYVKDIPWRELQIDTSFPFGRGKDVVVYTSIDDCSRYQFSRAYTNREAKTTLLFMKELIAKSPFPIQWIRTDQWTEFSREVTRYLESQWIKHIKNRWYTPEHNGKVERYHRTWKAREVRKWNIDMDLDEIQFRLNQRSIWYNEHRKHTGLGMNGMTPLQKIYSSLYYVQCVTQLLQQYILA